MVQQSNCFIVVERGQGMQNMMQERALAGGGEMRSGSNIGGGQMVAADFILTPAVVFSENNAGGLGGALGGLMGGKSGSVLGAVAGGLKFKEAQTSMLVADSRSGVQVAAAEGSTKKADLRLGVGLFGGGAAAASAVTATPTRARSSRPRSPTTTTTSCAWCVTTRPCTAKSARSRRKPRLAARRKRAPCSTRAMCSIPKIAGVKIMGTAAEAGKALATLDKGEELIYMGVEENGFVKIESGKGGGWVKKILVTK